MKTKYMSKFCLYCTGGDSKEVINCNFKYCPFHICRFGNAFEEERKVEEDLKNANKSMD